MSGHKILVTMIRNMDWHPVPFLWTWAVVGLEVYGRLLGLRDYKQRRNHQIWEIATTTKQLKMAANPKGVPKI
jgi:hypothetical protein